MGKERTKDVFAIASLEPCVNAKNFGYSMVQA